MKIIRSRIFRILVIVFILGVLFGIISYFLLDFKNSSINYFISIKNGDFNYKNAFINLFLYNFKLSSLIWILGIIFIFVLFGPIILFLRGISLGISILGIIHYFKLKSLAIGLIYMFPSIIVNELVFILLCYYSINFSIKLFDAFKNNKLINIKTFSLNYIYIYLILNSILLLSSLFETYISSNIIKFVL